MSRSSERVLVGTLVMFAALGSVSSARQTSTTTENRTFEVVAVNGNALVVREASGTMEYIVPDTFRFTTTSPATASPAASTPAASTPATPATVPETRNESRVG